MTGLSMARERTTLYRLFGHGGRLLYIGITMRLPVRLEEHEHGQPWWDDVVGATMEHFGNRRDAERAELAAIAAERPAYNMVGRPLRAAIARRPQTGLRSRAASSDNRIPLRSFRVPDDVWEHAKRCAEEEGCSVSAYIVAELRRWEPTPGEPVKGSA